MPFLGFGSLMDIDRLIQVRLTFTEEVRFGSLMDIDRLIHARKQAFDKISFGSLMDIDLPVSHSHRTKNIPLSRQAERSHAAKGEIFILAFLFMKEGKAPCG